MVNMNTKLNHSAYIDPAKIRFVPIPDLKGHDVIYSVLVGLDGCVYMGVSNEFHPEGFARLMSYDPKTERITQLIDLQELLPEGKDKHRPPHSKIHTAMCMGRDGTIWFATHVTAPPPGERFHRIWEIYEDPIRGFLGSHIISYNPTDKRVRDHGVIIPREGCRFMTMDLDREELHLVSYPRSHFIVYRPKTGEILDMGRISQVEALGPTWSANGFTYTSDDRGMLLRYDPEVEILEPLPIFVPDAPWRTPFGNRLRRMIAGPDGIKLYGFGWQSTRLFEYDPTVGSFGKMTDFGLVIGTESMTEPSVMHRAKALTFGKDGKIYCGMGPAQEEKEDQGLRIFSYDPDNHEIINHGLIKGENVPLIPYCQDMTTGNDGTIYIAPFVREHPLVLILFHPEGKLPGYKEKREQAPIEIQPMYSVYGSSFTDDQEWQAFRRDYRNRKRVFVTEGSLIARELCWPGKTPPIPAGESSISALELLDKRIIYGSTSGLRSHLFKFDPSPDREGPLNSVVDLGVIASSSGGVTCQSLVVAADNNLYMGTYCKNGDDGHIYHHDPEWELVAGFDQFMIPRVIFPGQQIVDLGVPVTGESVYSMTALPFSDYNQGQTLLCGITTPGGYLFLFDIEKRSTIFTTQINGRFLPRTLAVTPEGLVYGSQQDGQMFRFDPERLEIESLQLWLPAVKGREYLNTIDSMIRCEDGKFFGGTGADGFLFRFDPCKEKIISLGKPVRADRIRGLTISRSGEVFGLAGDDDVITHLFRFSPSTGDIRDLGILRATMPEEWIGHEFDAIITGPNGEIYIGESDRVSRLFTYFPPY
jgi:hypothetical protein